MTKDEAKVGQIIGYEKTQFRGIITKVDRHPRPVRGIFAYQMLRNIEGEEASEKDMKETHWVNEADFVERFFIISQPEPTEEMKPTKLPPTSQYRELLGV